MRLTPWGCVSSPPRLGWWSFWEKHMASGKLSDPHVLRSRARVQSPRGHHAAFGTASTPGTRIQPGTCGDRESAPEERSTPAAPFPKENSSRPKRWDHPGQKEERGLSAEPSRGARGARAGRGWLHAPLGPCRCQHGEVFSGLSG